MLAIGLGGGQVVLHESASGKTLATWDAHKHSVSRVVAVPGGRTLVTTGYDGRVALWDLAEGNSPVPLVLIEEGPPVRALAVSADGKRLALATETGRLEIWRMD